MEVSNHGPPIVLDTNVLVAGACRRESSLAYRLLMEVIEEKRSIILTVPIVMEYLDVLGRPSIRALTRLSRRQSEELVTDLVALSRKVQLRFSWRPNLVDESDNKFVEAAIHTSAVIVTYNTRDYRTTDLVRHGWTAMTPHEFIARFRLEES